MKPLGDAVVAVVGLGLMGGSLAGALRGRCRAVVGVARRPEALEAAVVRGLVDRGTVSLADGVCGADIVVLAAPVRAILRLLPEVGALAPEGCVVMDLGSTKAKIVAAMARLPARLQPIGGHPMCGRETSGIEAADPDLYRGCTFVLSPLARTATQTVQTAHALVEAVGGRPLVLDAQRHDRLAARISHVPYLLAAALVSATQDAAAEDPLLWELAASGFRDTSRLAASDVTMMLDTLMTNRDSVWQALQGVRTRLEELARLLEEGDEQGLRRLLAEARDSRSHLNAPTLAQAE